MKVAGQEFKVSTPERVLYPAAGTTKADVIDYYLQVADVLLPHLAGRPATRKRWPDGVDGPEFFAKDLEVGTPPWLTRVQIRHTSGPKFYPVLDTPAALGWLGQVSALEVHVPQWRITTTDLTAAVTSTTSSERYPDRVVFDLDPGPGAGLAQCVEVALYVRERLGPLGQRIVPVTSGSKGLHLYVPMDQTITATQATDWARLVAEQVEQAMPTLVVSKMTKALRGGKVLIDWSQNHPKKTTIAPYSLRGRTQPTVATPRTWDELADPDLAHLTYRQVLDRVAAGIDPLAALIAPPLEELRQAVGDTNTRTSTGRGATRRPLRPVPAAPPTATRPRGRSARPAAPPPPPSTAIARQVPVSEAEPAGAGDEVVYEPMLATLGTVGSLSAAGAWRLEGKWDGMRAVAHLNTAGGGGLVLRSRTGRDVTAVYPELAELPRLLDGRQAVLDGEIVAMDSAGRTDFGRLQQRIGLTNPGDIDRIRRRVPVAYLIFDILSLDGTPHIDQPLDDRRRLLESLNIAGTFCLVPPQLTGDPATVLAQTKADGWEGLIAKKADSRYLPGARTPAWIKLKNEHTLLAAVIGWQPGQGRRTDTIGSLLLAVPTDDHTGWRYIGKVGTGFTDRTLTELTATLTPLQQSVPAAQVPRPDARTAVWVTPTLVGEVAYTELTHLGTLRQPRWRGIRPSTQVSEL